MRKLIRLCLAAMVVVDSYPTAVDCAKGNKDYVGDFGRRLKLKPTSLPQETGYVSILRTELRTGVRYGVWWFLISGCGVG